MQTILDIDALVFLKIFQFRRTAYWNHLMVSVSWLGNGTIYPLVLLVLVIFRFSDTARVLAAGLAAFALEKPVSLVLKYTVKRGRPFEAIAGIHSSIPPQDRFSFPSGHTATAFGAAVVFSHALPLLALPAFGLAVLIGFSRIHNGVHYPLDVFTGLILGVFSGLIGIRIVY